MTRIYFTDRDLGKQFPTILRSAGLKVEWFFDHFEDKTEDDVWLADVAARGWIAVSHNSRIRYTPNQLAAVERHKASLLIVVGTAKYAELAHSFVNTLARIENFLDHHQAPFIAKVYRPTPTELTRQSNAPGKVTLWWPSA